MENTIKRLENYKKIYDDLYEKCNDKTSKAAIDIKKDIDALGRVIMLLESESEYQNDQDFHSEVTIEMETGREITLVEWAEKNGIDQAAARQRARCGMFKTARKVGDDWLINELEQNIDNRKK